MNYSHSTRICTGLGLTEGLLKKKGHFGSEKEMLVESTLGTDPYDTLSNWNPCYAHAPDKDLPP